MPTTVAPLLGAALTGPRIAPPVRGLGHLLAGAAAVSPDAEALVVLAADGRSTRLTYRALEADVVARAHGLLAAGLRRGDLALLLTARTADLVPTLLAMLRVGVGYVPVEPSAPEAHRRLVADLAGAAALVGPAALLPGVAASLAPGTTVLDAGALAGAVTVGSAEPPLPVVPGDTTAYVLFTSGSTGTPKGVVVSHGNVGHRLVSYAALTSGRCRYLLHSSLTFDGAVGGMFSTLARGGCLVLVPDEVAADPALAAKAVRAEAVTHLEPVPSWYAALLDLAAPGDLAEVRTVILGGEVLPPELAARSRRELPGARLFNDYGPTEVTVAATVFEVTDDALDGGDQARPGSGADVPIGRPHANTEVLVLDADLAPVAVGGTGELWVGGPCVAQGYLGLPDHEAFRVLVPGQGRWYRTGDLVRLDEAGLLHFAGRRDRQVKIRGQRVEPEQVEAVLGGLPGVTAAAVEVDGRGDTARLVAYACAASGTVLDAAALAGELADRLPGHLRPAVVVVLPELPLTAGGKVDRRALPAPSRATGSGEAPRDDLEQSVAEAFAEVLGGAVDRTTDFFADGGQSLGAARVVARLRTGLGVEVGLPDLAAARTPAGLADRLRGRPQADDEAPLQRAHRDPSEVWREQASPRQQSFWYLEHVPGGRGSSNLVEVLSFPQGTDPLLLERVVATLVARHASLRTGFELTTDGLDQVVRPHADVPVAVLPPTADEHALLGAADAFGAQPFDLGLAPLLRAARTTSPAGPALLLVVHHAVADGWSMDLLVEEVRHLVATDGDDGALPAPAVEYVDLAAWTAARPAGRRDAAVTHLSDLLHRSAVSGPRTLPFDRARTATPDVRAGLVRTTVAAATMDRLTALGRELGTTAYAVLAASFGVLLAVGSDQEEVVLGGPLSGRGDPLLDRVVGCCINTGLFPVAVGGGATFAEVVARTSAAATAAAPHTWLPLEVPLRPLPEGVRSQVVPVLLNLLEAPRAPGGTEAAVVRRSRPSTMAYAELDLYLEQRDGGLVVDAVHSLARLDPGTVERLLRRWLLVLDAALADPSTPVQDLPRLTAAEDAGLDRLEGDAGPGQPFHVLEEVRRLTAADPLALSVVDPTGPWTRQRLWDRAGAVAALLRRRGVVAGQRVLVALDEEADAVAALLGCWRAGAVPVPVGANQPGPRVAAVATACDAGAVLDPAALRAAAPGEAFHDVEVDATSTAYVLFTSGSTGEPKGVVVSHAALGHSTRARLVAYPGRPEVALLSHDLAFDAGIGIIAWYLGTGGTLVMARHEERLDPARLAALVRRHGVGQLDVVPSHHALLLELAGAEQLRSLRLVTLGGEACPPSLVAVHRTLLPEAVLVNEYGPTESTVWALAHTCDAGDERAPRVPVGRPVAGVLARVADERGRRLPRGAEGELLLAGHLLADGYLDSPDLTAARFVHHDGTRWYRTGDRARWNAVGEVEFLGRGDSQLKVRGFRIEPGEVEAALARLDDVARAAAGTVEVVAGAPVLVGWVQLTPAAAAAGATTAQLREQLLERLPDWLVPGVLVLVDVMPETTAGKVDRARLPLPQEGLDDGGAPPVTPTEVHVAAIWQDLLGRPVGTDQSFFALGGQSLLAARMVARVRDELAADVDLGAVLAAPRVRDVAAMVDAQHADRAAVAPNAAHAGADVDLAAVDLAEVDDLLARIEELDDDEVAALLARMESS